MFQLETELFRVEGHGPRDILHLISDSMHADDAVWPCTVSLIRGGGRSSFFSIHGNLLYAEASPDSKGPRVRVERQRHLHPSLRSGNGEERAMTLSEQQQQHRSLSSISSRHRLRTSTAIAQAGPLCIDIAFSIPPFLDYEHLFRGSKEKRKGKASGSGRRQCLASGAMKDITVREGVVCR